MSMRRALRRFCMAALVSCAALLPAACGGSGAGLIPTANAGPLVHDFEEVAKAARSGNGSCTGTTEAIEKTEADFARVSAQLASPLRSKLQVGITNLRKQALEECTQAISTSSTTTTTKTHTTEELVPVTTRTVETTQAPQTSAAPPGEETPGGGGTQAPERGGSPGGAEAEGGVGNENGGVNGGGH